MKRALSGMSGRFYPLIGAMLACFSVASAQTPSNPLGRFAGDWDLHGEAAGKSYHILEFCRWSNQGAFMLCEEREVGKPVDDMTLMWHDNRRNVYRFAGVGMRGPAGSGTIGISADRWIWSDVEGKDHYRTVNQWVTPDEIHYTSETSHDSGKTWKSDGVERSVACNALRLRSARPSTSFAELRSTLFAQDDNGYVFRVFA